MSLTIPYLALFSSTLILSTITAMSASHWLLLWMSLELNLLSFIPLIMSTNNSQESESSIKYFLAQAMGSGMILLSAIMKFIPNELLTESFNNMALIFGLMIKLGMAPCHFWFPNVMSGLNWIKALMLMTWQKLIPLFILFSSIMMKFQYMFWMLAALNAIIGGIGGMNQTHLRPMLAYSSIGHMGWMTASSIKSYMVSMSYLIIYIFISMNIMWLLYMWKLEQTSQSMNLMKSHNMQVMLIMIMLLSLGGLPPMLGFFPKWMVLECLISSNMMFLIFPLLIGSLMNLFYYLTVLFSVYMKWTSWTMYPKMNETKSLYPLISSISLSIIPTMFIII